MENNCKAKLWLTENTAANAIDSILIIEKKKCQPNCPLIYLSQIEVRTMRITRLAADDNRPLTKISTIRIRITFKYGAQTETEPPPNERINEQAAANKERAQPQ